MNRNQFMQFFRGEETLNTLSVEDRKEIFQTVLQGSSDITAELLNSIISDYNVQDLEVLDLSDKIRIVWCVEDVHNLASKINITLTNKDSKVILDNIKKHHCCTVGITNEIVSEYISDYASGINQPRYQTIERIKDIIFNSGSFKLEDNNEVHPIFIVKGLVHFIDKVDIYGVLDSDGIRCTFENLENYDLELILCLALAYSEV